MIGDYSMELLDKKYMFLFGILIFFMIINPLYADNSNMELNAVDNSNADDIGISNIAAISNTNSINNNADLNTANINNNHKTNSIALNDRGPKEINITNDNYNNYFNVYTGEILANADIIAGDTIRIGNVTNKGFVFDRKLTITTITPKDIIKNGVIHLTHGSSGSSVIGLNIINDKTDIVVDGITGLKLHGIWLTNTSNNYIFNNSVQLANSRGVFAMPMGWSNNNTIIFNILISTMSTCMPMGDSNYNNISNNYLQTSGANIIYYNPWGHADYSGTPICKGNYISNNYLYSLIKTPFAGGIVLATGYSSSQGQIYSDVTIINNTINNTVSGIESISSHSLIKDNIIISGASISTASRSNNITISNNTIYCAGLGIYIASMSTDILVSNNKVFNSSSYTAISVKSDRCVLLNNIVDTDSVYYGIYIDANGVILNNNTVIIRNFGDAIGIAGDNCQIFNNLINVSKNKGIVVMGSNISIFNNNIVRSGLGIVVDSRAILWDIIPENSLTGTTWRYPSVSNRIYFNVIFNNIINSNSYGIFLNGNVYNTSISGNIIYTNETMGIVKNITDYFGDDNSDNTVNGVVTDFTGLIINDLNFYSYFDNNGYFKLNSSSDSFIFILTFLSNKIINVDRNMTLFSNGLANLLTDVTIRIHSDGSGSTIKDLNFFNLNKGAIVVENYCNNINILNNNITIATTNGFKSSLTGISIGSCDFANITSNNIFMTTNNAYLYGISILDDSNYLNISNNSIILKGDSLVEGIYCILLGFSNISSNTINLMGNGFGYGIVTVNTNGPCHDLNITNNVILASIGQMLYLIELHITDNVTIENNYLNCKANGVYGISIYNSNNTIIKSNEIKVEGGNLNKVGYNPDVLGTGISAVYVGFNSNNTFAFNNTFYTNAKKQIILNNSNSELNNSFSNNYFVVYDDNIFNYFNSNYEFENNLVTQNDTLLFDNIKKYNNFYFNTPLNISSYSRFSVINSTFNFKSGASNSNISNLTFNLVDNMAILIVDGANITFCNNLINILSLNPLLKNLSAVVITQYSLNNTIRDNIIIMKGKSNLTAITVYNFFDGYYGRSPEFNNIIRNNINLNSSLSAVGIYNAMSGNTSIIDNTINVFAKDSACGIYNIYSKDFKFFISTLWTRNTNIINNTIYGVGNRVRLIESIMANNTFVSGNKLYSYSNASYGYVAYNTSGDVLEYNDIEVNGSTNNMNFINLDWTKVPHAGVYFSSGSSNCILFENSIVSNYLLANDYAVYIDGNNGGTSGGNSSNMIVKDNYLISDNNNRIANMAVFGPFAIISNNGHYYVYVSLDGSDEFGDGSRENPFRTIKYAVNKVINKGIIYVCDGIYAENDIVVNKTITIINLEYANNNHNNLNNSNSSFNNTSNSSSNIGSSSNVSNNENVVIKGNGGQIFNISKNGKLNVIGLWFTNSNGVNGSVFYNVGSLSINNCNFFNNSASNYGGVIFNNGTLRIEGSNFYDNIAYRGGVIANYLNLTILSSKFFNNSVYMNGSGAVIFAHEKSMIIISKSNFTNNSAFKGNTQPILQNYDENQISYASGGVLYNLGDLYIYDSIFDHNKARGMGGAIVSLSSSTIKDLLIVNSSFTYNSACSGGALDVRNNMLVILDSYFYENEATLHSGGALDISGGIMILDNVTMVSNSAAYGGGAIASWNTDSTITNSNITGNTGDVGGGIYFAGSNLGGHPSNSLTILNSTISSNIGFDSGGAFYVNNANVKMSNSNVFDNFASRNPTLAIPSSNDPPVSIIDFNDNWWGTDLGPTDDVWLYATTFRDWKREIISWGGSGIGGGSGSNPGSGNGSGSGSNPWYNPNFGGSHGGSGNGFGSGTGSGLGFGSGSGTGFGDGSGSGIGSGSGSGSGIGKGNGANIGRGHGSSSSDNFNMNLNSVGNINKGGNDHSLNPGGKSGGGSAGQSSGGGKNYEITKDTLNKISKSTPVIFGFIVVVLLLCLFVFGFIKRRKNSDY